MDQYWKKLKKADSLSDNFKDLIASMLSYDASKRPTIEEVRQHPWMQEASYDAKLAQ